MAEQNDRDAKRGPVALAEFVGRVLDPAIAKRGFATADLIAAWSEIIGTAYADCTAPEKILWPRGDGGEPEPATLVLRVDGPKSIYVQHELGEILNRINAFFGYALLGRIKLVQGRVTPPQKPAAKGPPRLDAEAERQVEAAVADVESEALRTALARLGRRVKREKRVGS